MDAKSGAAKYITRRPASSGRRGAESELPACDADVIARDDAEHDRAGRRAPAVDHDLSARAAQGDAASKIGSELSPLGRTRFALSPRRLKPPLCATRGGPLQDCQFCRDVSALCGVRRGC